MKLCKSCNISHFCIQGKKCGLYVSPHSENSVQFTAMKNKHIPKKFRPVEDSHTGTTNFTWTASLPLWINLQFLKTSWKGVIFCHLKLWSVWKIKWNKIKHTTSRKLCWLSRYMTTRLTRHLNVDMMDQTSNKMKYLSLYNIQHTINLNTGTDVIRS